MIAIKESNKDLKSILCNCGAKLYIEESDIKIGKDKCIESVFHYYHDGMYWDDYFQCYMFKTRPRFTNKEILCEIKYVNCPFCGKRYILNKIPLESTVIHHNK